MVIFFGPMGAGKSVQGQILSARHGWRWLSAGQLLRDTHDPELLKVMSTGALVDEDTVNKVVLDAIQRSKNIERLVLDGFPRTLEQAKWLVESQPEHERAVELVVVLEVPQSELLRRLRLRGRADDQPDVIEKRMSVYRKEIYPILTYLTDKHIRIVHIDGMGTVGQVHDRIQAELEACSLA
jgi:adenylate kinase